MQRFAHPTTYVRTTATHSEALLCPCAPTLNHPPPSAAGPLHNANTSQVDSFQLRTRQPTPSVQPTLDGPKPNAHPTLSLARLLKPDWGGK